MMTNELYQLTFLLKLPVRPHLLSRLQRAERLGPRVWDSLAASLHRNGVGTPPKEGQVARCV